MTDFLLLNAALVLILIYSNWQQRACDLCKLVMKHVDLSFCAQIPSPGFASSYMTICKTLCVLTQVSRISGPALNLLWDKMGVSLIPVIRLIPSDLYYTSRCNLLCSCVWYCQEYCTSHLTYFAHV